MPRQPQPVPPIFQPEVAADAIVWAAGHRRRELDVGFSTIKAVIAQKIVPGFADRYLATTGYDSQQPHNQPIRIGLTTCSLPFTDNSRHTADSIHKRA
jgi:hypothetical protein